MDRPTVGLKTGRAGLKSSHVPTNSKNIKIILAVAKLYICWYCGEPRIFAVIILPRVFALLSYWSAVLERFLVLLLLPIGWKVC
jgi:hypothetical protein